MGSFFDFVSGVVVCLPVGSFVVFRAIAAPAPASTRLLAAQRTLSQTQLQQFAQLSARAGIIFIVAQLTLMSNISAAGWIGGLLTLGVLALYSFQDYLLYYPQVPKGSRTEIDHPSLFGLENIWSEHNLTTSDGVRLQSWLFKYPGGGASTPTLLYFHGNAGNIGHRLVRCKFFVERLQANVLILAYRGYSRSEGYPSEPGLKNDAQAALDFLRSRSDINPNKIIVYGESLGGAVGTHLVAANQEKVAALIVENTFTSVSDMVGVVFPPLGWFAPFCTNPWRSIDVIGRIRVPILFLSGGRDELVPPAHMDALYGAATGSTYRELRRFEEGEHNNTWMSRGFHTAIRNFLSARVK